MFMLLQTRKEFSDRSYHRTDPQILDLLQFSRQEMEQKKLFLALKRSLQKIDSRHDAEKTFSLQSFMQSEREILRREVERAALIYRMIKRERIRLFRDYISRLPLRTK